MVSVFIFEGGSYNYQSYSLNHIILILCLKVAVIIIKAPPWIMILLFENEANLTGMSFHRLFRI